MHVIETTNVNTAVATGIPYLLENGLKEGSRNGATLVAPGPVCTVYKKPWQRVLFSQIRNANPFFHLMESLWMLDGRNDLDFPKKFNSRFGEYSDDGKTVWGAYGWRWKEFFGYDQLDKIIAELQVNPESRRCVLSMWNGVNGLHNGDFQSDLHIATQGGKDVPCNTHAYFDLRGGKLNMTVCCRSNDVVWGAYGANAVHFSFLQEYMAHRLEVGIGVYRQMSNNFHAYTGVYSEKDLTAIAEDAGKTNLYAIYPEMKVMGLSERGCDWSAWHQGLSSFLDTGFSPSQEFMFLSGVAEPMYRSWGCYKDGDYDTAFEFLAMMPYCDWKVASIDWMKRSEQRGQQRAA